MSQKEQEKTGVPRIHQSDLMGAARADKHSNVDGIESGVQEMIGARYDSLLAERDQLDGELAKYDRRYYDIIFSDSELADDSKVAELVKIWLERADEQTEFLHSLKRLGIQIFKDDLENQPGFPDTTISFNTDESIRQGFRCNAGGLASVSEPIINIPYKKPDLRTQVHNFLATGNIDGVSLVLVHELTHRYHIRESRFLISSLLSEAQAYYSSIISKGTQFSPTSIIGTLIKPKYEEGYGFDSDSTIDALRTVAQLYGLGKDDRDVADLIASSRGLKPEDRLTDTLKKEASEYNLDEIDLQALNDIHRLHLNNQRLKAQLILYQTLSEHYSLDELKARKLASLKKGIFFPVYKKGGENPAERLCQNWVLPVNDEYPYDFEGKRTGVIFGIFENEDGMQDFNIGRLEAEEKDSSLTLADSDKKVDEYIEVLRKQASGIVLSDKLQLFQQFLYSEIYEFPVGKKVLEALISSEEAQAIFRSDIIARRTINIIAEIDSELSDGFGITRLKLDYSRRNRYLSTLIRLKSFLQFFKLSANVIEEGLDQKIDDLIPRIEEIKSVRNKDANEARG